MVRKYTSARFGAYSTGKVLTEDESRLLTGIQKVFYWSLSLRDYNILIVSISIEDKLPTILSNSFYLN